MCRCDVWGEARGSGQWGFVCVCVSSGVLCDGPRFHTMDAGLTPCARLLQLCGRGGGPLRGPRYGMQTRSERRHGVPAGLHHSRRSRHHRCVRCHRTALVPRSVCRCPPASHVEPCVCDVAENDIAIFHISLWSSVFLVMATCYGGCMLTYMDTGDDSIFNIDISDAVKKAN